MDSYWHKLEKIQLGDIDGLTEQLNKFFTSTLDEVNKVVKSAVRGSNLFSSAVNSISGQISAYYENIDITSEEKEVLTSLYNDFNAKKQTFINVLEDALSDGILTVDELAGLQAKYLAFNFAVRDFFEEYQLLQNYLLESKQNKLVKGNLVKLTDDVLGRKTTIDVLSDPAKQDKLVNVDGTVVLTPNEDGTVGIKAISIQTVQIDSTGGTKVLTVTGEIVSVTAASQVNYIGFDSNFNTIKFVNNSELQVIFSFDNPEAGNNKIIKDAVMDTIIINKAGSVEFFKTVSGWRITGLFGVSYFPDKADKSREEDYSLLVNPDGTTKIEKIGLIEKTDESIVITLTREQLNTMYPEALVGFSLICPRINTMYKKTNMSGSWYSIALNSL